MAAAVRLTINLRDGSSQNISQVVSSDHTNVRYDQLIKSISKVQEQANNILTTLVNKEKAQKNSTDYCVDDSNRGVSKSGELETNSNANETDSTDDDDDEEEDDDSTDKPPEKKQKT